MKKGNIYPGVLASAYLAVAAFLFLLQPYGLDRELGYFMFGLSLPAAMAVFHPRHPRHLNCFLEKKTLIWVCLIALYGAFCCFGWCLLDIDAAKDCLNPGRWLCFLLSWAWCVLGVLAVLYGLRCLCAAREEKQIPERSRKNRILVWLISFGVFAVVATFLSILLYPGGFYTDSKDILLQAEGSAPLNDWHPVFNTMLERAIISIFPNLWFITWVQCMGFAPLFASYVLQLYEDGFSPLPMILIGCLLLLLPNQAMNGVCVQKDTPFAYAMLGVLLLLYQMAFHPEKAEKPAWICWMSLALFSILALRHNGIVPAGFTCVLLVILGARLLIRKISRKRAAALLMAGILPLTAYGIWKGPVYKQLQVIPNEQSAFIFALNALGACAHEGLPLSEETTARMEEIQTMRDWAEYYSRFSGHDSYVWGIGKDVEGFDTSSITLPVIVKMYLEALCKYPLTVLNDRISGSAILWDVTMPPGTSSARFSWFVYETVPEKYQFYPFRTLYPQYIRDHWTPWYIRQVNASQNTVPNLLLWRSGIYVIFLYILLLYWWTRKEKRLWLPASVLLIHLLSCYVVVYEQSFRYVWVIQLMTLALLAMTAVTAGHKGGQHEQEC